MGGAPTRARDCNPCGLSAGPLPRTTTESLCWQLLESYLFSPKNTAGNERSLAMGMGVGQMAFLSPFPEQQDFCIFILSLTEEENKLCVLLFCRVRVSKATAGYKNSEAFWANPPIGQMERGARVAQGIVQRHPAIGGPSSDLRLLLTLALWGAGTLGFGIGSITHQKSPWPTLAQTVIRGAHHVLGSLCVQVCAHACACGNLCVYV